MSESAIQKRVMLALSGAGTSIFRNNTGQAWVGDALPITERRVVSVGPGDVVIRHARRFHAGLIKGSSDLIGWTSIPIRATHVGSKVAVFTAVEVKTESGRPSTEQENFLSAVNVAGGIGGIARDEADAIDLVSKLNR